MLQYTEPIDNKSLFEIIRRTCNCVDPRLMDHGLRVAYIAAQILKKTGENDVNKLRDFCLVTVLHDIGAYKTEEISKMLLFETQNMWEHSMYGYLFLKYFSPLEKLSPVVLYHHTPWEELAGINEIDEETKRYAQIVHIADRIDVFTTKRSNTWEACALKLREGRDRRFASWLVDLVLEPGFYYALQSIDAQGNNFDFTTWGSPLTQEQITDYLKMLIYIIDFRSRHTVTHTITTTNISYELGRRMNLDSDYLDKIVCGAFLHDVGKVGVPVEILEYPGRLSPQAMNVMRKHVDITGEIFGGEIDETIQNIALRHHEKLDGSGYPLGLTASELTVGERIVAVADIVSALTGTRSYKDAYPKERVLSIVSEQKDLGKIDSNIVDILIKDYDEIMASTRLVCQPVLDKYENIQKDFQKLL